MFALVFKAALIFDQPLTSVAHDCAASFNPHQLLKGVGLHKNERPMALFGVTAETLLGMVRWKVEIA